MSAQKKELEITIGPDGNVSVRVKCGDGTTCVDDTKFLEAALGGQVENRELLPEYYDGTVSTTNTQKTGR
jgi:Protein of unknown function (DUF2997)